MFGFEIQPVRSRNWEIEEEEDQEVVSVEIPKPSISFVNDNYKLEFNNNNDTPFNIIVSTNGSPSIFVKGCFESNQFDEIADISYSDIKPLKTTNTNTVLNNKCTVYRHKIEKSMIFITVQYDLPSERCFGFTELVLNTFKNVSQVLVLDKILNTHYLSQNYTHPIPPFTRAIFNSLFKNDYSLTPLESSNIIENLSASFLTICQVKYIPACSILNLYESHLNIESVQSFTPIVKSIYPQLFNNSSLKQEDITSQFKLMINALNKRNDKGMYM
ncbi:proteasome assembly chaperone 1 [Dictyostelium discoideum AX4]|uniref:Proteasome assembly chaperone 1 n=1 Tax=Dictyostelium discoideum TaxID=44689 RepID=PSMG1_DICDI|nr:proteasome assembly chaperone 1 [Dictyostelium discoideum AX4]Q54WB6.1 RecName: Full=Proteasome assembly chaperone 1 [Dictyostelium discoideum]EAL67564.1 proteasome assembly chaperone 1 [Dictyostelium discoideum AX4]|eukprot:XP_641542.1 proteasome assembly chaperone 1 [Dictyostelium discoideum AX4]